METNRDATLDFLRGIAICGVVLLHTYIIFNFSGVLTGFIAGLGVYGVQLFFIVSAWTMCMMWDRRKGEPQPSWRFYSRRFLRIAPPFWLGIVGYLALFGWNDHRWSPEGVTWGQIVVLALFMHTFWPDTINAIVPGGWSIGVEMFFYAWFPLISSIKRHSIVLALAVALYLLNLFAIEPAYRAAFASYPYQQQVGEFLYFQFFNQAPIFLLGIALYRNDGKVPKAEVTLLCGWLAFAFSLKAFGVLRPAPFFWLTVFCLLAVASLAIRLRLRFAPLDFLGRYSYEIYLLHFAAVYTIELGFQRANIPIHHPASFVAALVLTLSSCAALGSILNKAFAPIRAMTAWDLRRFSYRGSASR